MAALGDCVRCHTAQDGDPLMLADGRRDAIRHRVRDQLTPDPDTGLGSWSYAAFERAMREGIHRDGRHLYPAFPYTHFAMSSEADMQALYAFLMAQEPVGGDAANGQLSSPSLQPAAPHGGFGMRCSYQGELPFDAAPVRRRWNRGKYLVEGFGHCCGLPQPRNALGAERRRRRHLAGGWVDGWEAPPLTVSSQAPIPWSEQDLFGYLRTGFSPVHGAAAGPMAPVITELQVFA